MNIRPIRNDTDLAWALGEIEVYFDHEPQTGTPEHDRFAILATLISAYEAEHHPVEPLEPVAMLEVYMHEHGLNGSDLGTLIGSRSRASEILSRKRTLTLGMINQIADAWKLPVADLAKPYALNKQPRAA
ncbi:MAG: XRE family transcriptional regulator [Rhizobiaceae bacterium]